MDLGKIKRGDTFAFTVEILDAATEAPLTGAAGKLHCQGKRQFSEKVLVEMEISETETPGTYLFKAPSTEDWPPNDSLKFDIEYRDGDIVASSATFYVAVERDVTNA